ncbi:MAG: hypothetical protein ABIF10_01665 [Candidatus Woesearchaeota archaeon]
MGEIKIEIPEELRKEVAEFSDIDMSIAVSRLVKSEFDRLARLRRIVSKSKLTQEKASEISDAINRSLSKRYRGL